MTPLSLPLILTTLRDLARPVTTRELGAELGVNPDRLPMYLRALAKQRRACCTALRPGVRRYWWHPDVPAPDREARASASTLDRMARHLGLIVRDREQLWSRVYEETGGDRERWRTVREAVGACHVL